MEEESGKAMPDVSDRATPIEEDPVNESRVENEQSKQPQPVDNVVERQIRGKVFKLGRFLSQEEREEVAAVISRHLDAFAWTAANMPGILLWTPRFALCDREGGSSRRNDASS